jgi:hypothetical protein
MRTCSLLQVVGLLAVVTAAAAQPPPPVVPGAPRGPQVPPISSTAPPLVPTAPPLVPTAPSFVPAPPAEPSIEQLLKELEAVQAQKAEILKREADLKAAVQKKLEAIQKQADKLGAGKAAPDAGGLAEGQQPPRIVGRVVIEGAANKKVDQMTREVLDKVGLTPGAVYRRPALDDARELLGKAGFTRANLETVTTGPGALDIRVRFAPEGDR